MSQPAAISAAFMDKILTLLAPIFLSATNANFEEAREAVRFSLAEYNARTEEELRLAALTFAFGMGALEALSKSADPGLSFNQAIRLRGNAVSLHKAGEKISQTLQARHKQHPPAEAGPADSEAAEPEMPASVEPADLIAFVRSMAPARPAAAPAPQTRQQRRAAERAAEKARRQQEYQARRAALVNAG